MKNLVSKIGSELFSKPFLFFLQNWVYSYDELYLVGSRWSAKTSSVANYLVLNWLSQNQKSIIAFRRIQKTIRRSIYEEIDNALKRFDLKEGVDYEFEKTNNRFVSLNPNKKNVIQLHYVKIAEGDNHSSLAGLQAPSGTFFGFTWIEEAFEFSDAELAEIKESMRRGCQFIFSFNPKRKWKTIVATAIDVFGEKNLNWVNMFNNGLGSTLIKKRVVKNDFFNQKTKEIETLEKKTLFVWNNFLTNNLLDEKKYKLALNEIYDALLSLKNGDGKKLERIKNSHLGILGEDADIAFNCFDQNKNVLKYSLIERFILENQFSEYGFSLDYGLRSAVSVGFYGVYKNTIFRIDEFNSSNERDKTKYQQDEYIHLVYLFFDNIFKKYKHLNNYSFTLIADHGGGGLGFAQSLDNYLRSKKIFNIKIKMVDKQDIESGIERINDLFINWQYFISDKCKENINELSTARIDVKRLEHSKLSGKASYVYVHENCDSLDESRYMIDYFVLSNPQIFSKPANLAKHIENIKYHIFTPNATKFF